MTSGSEGARQRDAKCGESADEELTILRAQLRLMLRMHGSGFRHLTSIWRDVGIHAWQGTLQPLTASAHRSVIEANRSTMKPDGAGRPGIAPERPPVTLTFQLDIGEFKASIRQRTRHRSSLGRLVLFLPPKVANAEEFDSIWTPSACYSVKRREADTLLIVRPRKLPSVSVQ
jgi:hypothetical protein